MAADAQRLVAISMGKITASRGQRGGINLHKNLLVATVLTKARTIMILENYRDSMVDLQNRRIQLESEESIMHPVENRDNSTTTCHEKPRNDEAQNGGIQHQQPSCMYSTENITTRSHVEDKENSPPQSSEIAKCDENDELNSDNCVRCTKRRFSEDEYYSLDSENSQIPCAKRCKRDLESEIVNDHDNSVPKCEPMQTETTQITNLVNSFSSGFTGLLNHESPHNTSADQGYSSAEEDDDDDDVFTPNSCTKSENSLISCSTQIKEAFETLARPCIALTV